MKLEWALEQLMHLAIWNHSLKVLIKRQNKALYLAAKERDELLAWKNAALKSGFKQ